MATPTDGAIDQPRGESPHGNAGADVRSFSPTRLVKDLLEDASNFELRSVNDLEQLRGICAELRAMGLNIVLTSGSYDILHEGHSMYLEAARNLGDFLIVGVDSDEKIRRRKGPSRPAVPESERLRMVTHQRGVGLVVLKGVAQPRWALIRAVRPEVLVVTEETYTAEEIRELESGICGKVVVLPRMATISTSARLRLLQLRLAEAQAERIAELIPDLMREVMPDLIRRVTEEMSP